MTQPSSILITDASIFFDLELADCWNAFFELPYTCITSYYVWDELDEALQNKLSAPVENGMLILREPSDDFTEDEMELQKWNRLSLPDKSIYNICMETGGILLTSDGVLRDLSMASSLPTHGLLWLFDEMVKNKSLNPETAIKKLEIVFERNVMYRNNRALQRAFNRIKKGWNKHKQ